MENKGVVYIDYLNSYTEVTKRKLPKWLSWCVYKLCNYFGFIKKNDNFFTLIAEQSDVINEKMLNNLYEKLFELDIKTVVCAELLLKNERFVKWLREKEVEILDGRWLFRFLPYDIFSKIAYIKNVKKSDLEVSILVNKPTELSNQNAVEFAKECKILNIITNDVNAFRVLEKRMLDEYGIIINVSTNKEKSCARSDLIFNFDFNQKDLKKCKMNNRAVLVQLDKGKFVRNDGVTIRFVKLNIPYKYEEIAKVYRHFNEEILYESFLYYKTSYKNVRKILKRDGVNIRYFIGNNGKIEFNEFRL